VRHLAAPVLATCPRLGVPADNAGGFWAHRHVTAGGHGHTMALSHLMPFLLTSLLLGPAHRQRARPDRHRLLRRPGQGPAQLR
jgi:hypothetical protein